MPGWVYFAIAIAGAGLGFAVAGGAGAIVGLLLTVAVLWVLGVPPPSGKQRRTF